MKNRPKVLERGARKALLVDDGEGEKVMDVEGGGPSPAAVVVTPWEINQGLVKAKAKELFMVHRWSPKQLLELGIPRDTLNTWLYRPTENSFSWQQERDIFDASVMERMKSAAAECLQENFSRTMSVLAKSLLEFETSGTLLKTPKQFKDMISVAKEFRELLSTEKAETEDISGS